MAMKSPDLIRTTLRLLAHAPVQVQSICDALHRSQARIEESRRLLSATGSAGVELIAENGGGVRIGKEKSA
jgi:hypothetical protein